VSTPKKFLLLVITSLAGAPVFAQDSTNLVSTVIRGSSVYSASELFPVYGEHLGKPITTESARSIATRIAQKYVSDGYSRPGVRIDDRLVGVGVLAIDVTETRISSVEITGDPGPYGTQLRSLGERLGDDPLLRSADLQSTVRLMRALPGLRLTTSTEPELDRPGAYRLNVDTEFRPVSGTVRLTNRGTDQIGPQFLLGQITANGVLAGRADVGLMFGSASNYGEYHGLGSSARFAVTDDDLSVAISGFRSRSDPTEFPIDRDDRYLRDRLTLGVVKRPRGESNRQLTLTAGLRAEDLEIVRSGTGVRDERLRLIDFGMRWTVRPRSTAQFAAGFELSKAFNGVGSGLRADDLADDPRSADFSMLVIDFVRVTQLSGFWSWRLNALAQHSGDTIPYSQRFKIGGDRLGRGFEVAEIAGDRGMGAKVELVRRLGGVPDVAGPVSIYSFYDIGAAWKNDEPGRESAASAGVGLALNGARTNGRLEIAKPLTHADVEGRDDLRVFVEFSVSW
jgi:hemolysin activation/secretion protein